LVAREVRSMNNELYFPLPNPDSYRDHFPIPRKLSANAQRQITTHTKCIIQFTGDLFCRADLFTRIEVNSNDVH
jgi:hypothetical protein